MGAVPRTAPGFPRAAFLGAGAWAVLIVPAGWVSNKHSETTQESH